MRKEVCHATATTLHETIQPRNGSWAQNKRGKYWCACQKLVRTFVIQLPILGSRKKPSG